MDRIYELFFAVVRNGADRQVGRKLGELYRDAGLEDVAVEARASTYPLGHSRRTIRVDLVRAMRPQILELGLADELELDELDAMARAHLQNKDVVVMPHLTVLAWGRKPTARVNTSDARIGTSSAVCLGANVTDSLPPREDPARRLPLQLARKRSRSDERPHRGGRDGSGFVRAEAIDGLVMRTGDIENVVADPGCGQALGAQRGFSAALFDADPACQSR